MILAIEHNNPFLLFLGLGLVFQAVNAESTNQAPQVAHAITNDFGLSAWAILPAEKAVTSRGFTNAFGPVWNPSTNEVAETIRLLPDYLKNTEHENRSYYSKELAGVRRRLPTTVCQFVGVTCENRKGILLNCLPRDHSSSRNWKERLVRVHDGGPRWWSVVYMLDEQKFTRLHVDLGF